MKTLFDIPPDREIGSGHTLLLEAGSDYCCRAYLRDKRIEGLRFATFGEIEAEESLTQLVSEEAKTGVQKAVVCSAFAQALLTPAKFFTQDYSLLDVLYGQPAQAYLNDAVPEWQMTMVYAMPAIVHEALQSSFSSLQTFHAYTPAVKVYNGYVADNQLALHFNPQHFRVLVKKDANLVLAQTYAYKTPLDVVYYLLKICYEFNLAQQNVYLILSGLIEQESSLFAELQQYFSNVHFAHPPEIAPPNDSYPHHFFTSIYNLASCVS